MNKWLLFFILILVNLTFTSASIEIDNSPGIEYKNYYKGNSSVFSILTFADDSILTIGKKGANESLWLAKFDKHGELEDEVVYAEISTKITGKGVLTENGNIFYSYVHYNSTYDAMRKISVLKIKNDLTIEWHLTLNRSFDNMLVDFYDLSNDELILIAVEGHNELENSNIIITKINSEGTMLWDKVYHSGNIDFVMNSLLRKDNSILMCAYKIIYKDDERYQLTKLFKFDSNGDLVWNKTHNDITKWGFYIQEEDDNDIFMMSNYGDYPNLDYYFITFNSTGDYKEEKIVKTKLNTHIVSIIKNDDNSFTIASDYNNYTLSNNRSYFYSNIKDGHVIWQKEIQLGENDFGYNIVNTNSGFFVKGSRTYNYLNSYEAFLIKLNNNIRDFKISLNQGWNLFSVPFILLDNSTSSIFDSSTYSGLYGYKNGWYYPQEISPGIGYWIYSKNSQEVDLTGWVK